MNVLLVDDEPMMRKMVKRTLEKRGIHVLDAGSGAEALTLSQQHPVDVLVTDVVMNDMDGWTLAQVFSEQYPQIPVLFTSGYPVDLAREHPQCGRWSFLPKPFHPADLMN